MTTTTTNTPAITPRTLLDINIDASQNAHLHAAAIKRSCAMMPPREAKAVVEHREGDDMNAVLDRCARWAQLDEGVLGAETSKFIVANIVKPMLEERAKLARESKGRGGNNGGMSKAVRTKFEELESRIEANTQAISLLWQNVQMAKGNAGAMKESFERFKELHEMARKAFGPESAEAKKAKAERKQAGVLLAEVNAELEAKEKALAEALKPAA